MTPDWQAHDCRVTLRALKRFGMVPGNDSRTMFGALLVHLLRRCCALAEEAAASDRSRANRGRSDDGRKDCKWQPSSSSALRASAGRIPLTLNTEV
jgi:hypothetical protein